MHDQAPLTTHNGPQQQEGRCLTKKAGNNASLPQEDVSTWDELTIVNPVRSEALPGLCIPKSKTNEMRKPSVARSEKREPLQCPFCDKVCIKQAELSNHLGIIHRVEQDDGDEILVVQQPSEEVSSEAKCEELLFEHGHATIKPRAHIEEDQTIKAVPLLVTSAMLRAHDWPTREELAESMDELSISQAHESSPSEISFAETTYSVDDVDSRTLSEVADPVSPRIHEPVRILLCLFMKLFFDFSQRFSTGIRQHAPFSTGNDHHRSAVESTESLVSESVQSSQASGVKRPRNNEEDENEEEGDRKNNKSRKRSGPTSPDDRPLACPFNKYDSRIFGVDGDQAYHVCSTFSDIKTAYFKQHLVRTHCMPEHYCDRCGLDCKNPAALRSHLRAENLCAVKELDKQKIMPEIQVELGLKTRNTIKTNRTEYWNRVYDLIFGKQSRIDRNITPYYEGPLHEHLQSFMRFSEIRLPQVIRQAHENLGYDPETYSEYDRQLGRQILQEARQSFMTTMRSHQAPNLRETQLQNLENRDRAQLSEQNVATRERPRRIERRLSFNEPVNVASQRTPSVDPQLQMTSRQISLPTRSAAPNPLTAPSSYGFQQQIEGPTYYNYVPSDFEHAPFLTSPEFEAVIEDSDLYGPDSLTQNDIEGFTFVDNPAQYQGPHP